jgi:hypothetical protein
MFNLFSKDSVLKLKTICGKEPFGFVSDIADNNIFMIYNIKFVERKD